MNKDNRIETLAENVKLRGIFGALSSQKILSKNDFVHLTNETKNLPISQILVQFLLYTVNNAKILNKDQISTSQSKIINTENIEKLVQFIKRERKNKTKDSILLTLQKKLKILGKMLLFD